MGKTFIILGIIIGLGIVWFAFSGRSEEVVTPQVEEVNTTTNQEVTTQEEIMENTFVTFKTNKGDIMIELFNEKMPITAGNFLKLAQEGFYDGTKFHRVINGFMIQGGDPNSKGDDTSLYGQGGPGYAIEDEFVEGFSNVRGTISMANSGPQTGGSQFFINLGNNSNLDWDKEPAASKHPVFGRVTEGMDIVDSIAQVATGVADIPVEPVIIESIVVKE